jgi:SAM-dependent methyltransferase
MNIAKYDKEYLTKNFYGYKAWIYRPFLRALAAKAELPPKARILDLGCGQGLFSALFSELGYSVTGIDLSETAIASARAEFGSSDCQFEVNDILALPYQYFDFDCVFVRSCSLYNTADLSDEVTDRFLSYLRPGGILIFVYNTKLSRSTPREQTGSWYYHNLDRIREHFDFGYGGDTYFSLRYDTLLFGPKSFSQPVTVLAEAVSKSLGVGGEIVSFIRKC